MEESCVNDTEIFWGALKNFQDPLTVPLCKDLSIYAIFPELQRFGQALTATPKDKDPHECVISFLCTEIINPIIPKRRCAVDGD